MPALFYNKEDCTINSNFNRNIPIKPDKVSKDLVNERIPFQQMMVIDPDGKQIGVMKRADALRLSEDMGLDLLVVASKANPPVCKILDYGKFHFEKQKKDRQQIRSQRVAQRDAKEIRFRVNISDHDLETKATMAKKYLQKGLKVKVGIFLRGRQVTKTDITEGLMNKFLDLLKEFGAMDKKPVQEGKIYSCLVLPLSK